jgi:hypothetical protein
MERAIDHGLDPKELRGDRAINLALRQHPGYERVIQRNPSGAAPVRTDRLIAPK